MNNEVYIIKRTGVMHGTPWMQMERIKDSRIDALEYQPALLGGWKVVRSWTQGTDDWGSMTADKILAFRLGNEPKLEVVKDPSIFLQVSVKLDEIERAAAATLHQLTNGETR